MQRTAVLHRKRGTRDPAAGAHHAGADRAPVREDLPSPRQRWLGRIHSDRADCHARRGSGSAQGRRRERRRARVAHFYRRRRQHRTVRHLARLSSAERRRPSKSTAAASRRRVPPSRPGQGRILGALELDVRGHSIRAIGIITTRMPDGSRGFSLLILIATEFRGSNSRSGSRCSASAGCSDSIAGSTSTCSRRPAHGRSAASCSRRTWSRTRRGSSATWARLPAAARPVPVRADGQARLGHADARHAGARRDARDPRQRRDRRHADAPSCPRTTRRCSCSRSTSSARSSSTGGGLVLRRGSTTRASSCRSPARWRCARTARRPTWC